MNTTTTARRTTTTQRVRRAGSLSVAGALACLALAPAIAHADQVTTDGGTLARSHDIDDVVTARKVQSAWNFGHPARRSPTSTARYVFAVRPGCNIPASLDDWSRRLIAVQDCSKAQLVPAALARVAFVEPIPDPGLASASVGHCGHEALHQPSAASGLPVSIWFTPTSC